MATHLVNKLSRSKHRQELLCRIGEICREHLQAHHGVVIAQSDKPAVIAVRMTRMYALDKNKFYDLIRNDAEIERLRSNATAGVHYSHNQVRNYVDHVLAAHAA